MSLRFGISTALVTPFTAAGVDVPRLASHADECLRRGCTTATVFGTTGEGPSVETSERNRVAAELIALGIPAARLVEGVIACSIEEAADCTRRALQRGAHAVLLAPPFYFRPVPDEAVLAWFTAVFRSVGSGLRDIVLYHIPGMTGVPLSHSVIRRLAQDFPGAIRGVKDSAGDAEATFALIKAFPELDILVGDERYLGRACAAGGAGSICGMANLVPEAIIALAESGRDDSRVVALVDEIVSHPVVPMVKALVAHLRQDRVWAVTKPPLAALDEQSAARAIALLARFAAGSKALS